MTGIGPVEADNIKVPVFNPDSSAKRPLVRFFYWLDIDYDATRFAKKLAPHKCEVIILFLQVRVEHHHLREALRQESVGQRSRDRIRNVVQKPLALPLEN